MSADIDPQNHQFSNWRNIILLFIVTLCPIAADR